MEHTTAGNSALVFNLATLHFHMRSSHGFPMLACNGWKVGVGLKVLAPVAIDKLSFL